MPSEEEGNSNNKEGNNFGPKFITQIYFAKGDLQQFRTPYSVGSSPRAGERRRSNSSSSWNRVARLAAWPVEPYAEQRGAMIVTAIVYELVNSSTGQVRHVGKTTPQNIKRILEILKRDHPGNTELGKWIRQSFPRVVIHAETDNSHYTEIKKKRELELLMSGHDIIPVQSRYKI